MKVPRIRNGARGISTLYCDETHLAHLLPIPTPSRTAPTCRIRGTCAAFSGLLNMSIRCIQRLLSASSKSERFVQLFAVHTALQTRTVIFFRISLWGLCFTQPFLSIQQGDRVRYLENLPATLSRLSAPASPPLLACSSPHKALRSQQSHITEKTNEVFHLA